MKPAVFLFFLANYLVISFPDNLDEFQAGETQTVNCDGTEGAKGFKFSFKCPSEWKYHENPGYAKVLKSSQNIVVKVYVEKYENDLDQKSKAKAINKKKLREDYDNEGIGNKLHTVKTGLKIDGEKAASVLYTYTTINKVKIRTLCYTFGYKNYMVLFDFTQPGGGGQAFSVNDEKIFTLIAESFVITEKHKK